MTSQNGETLTVPQEHAIEILGRTEQVVQLVHGEDACRPTDHHLRTAVEAEAQRSDCTMAAWQRLEEPATIVCP
jgi:hypothetical protein